MTSHKQAQLFLQALHHGVKGRTELRCLKRGEAPVQIFLHPEEATQTFLDQLLTEAEEDRVDVYVGVATRYDFTSGALDNCVSLPALYVDIDFKDVNPEDAWLQVAEFPLAPSMVVSSGGGLHVYWLLNDPFTLPREAASAAALLRQLVRALPGSDIQAAEAARVLRVPGSVNIKRGTSVVLEHFCPELRYSRADFAFLPAEAPAAPATANRAGTGDWSKIAVEERVRRARGYLARVAVGESRHNDLFRAGCIAYCDFALPYDEALALLAERNEGYDEPVSDWDVIHQMKGVVKKEVTGKLLTRVRPLCKGGRMEAREHERSS